MPQRAAFELPKRSILVTAMALLCLAGPAPAAQRWNEMDYGPFLTSSVTMHPPNDPETVKGVTVRAITVKVGPNASVCFDTNLMRYAAGWTGGWLKLMGTPFDGTHRPPEGSRPAVQGDIVFETSQSTPGWASPQGDFFDPRPEPYVPLPHEYAHYKGLYIDGDHVVFSYTVGDCDVLECPWYDDDGKGHGAFTRTFKFGPSLQDQTIVVCESAAAPGTRGIAPPGAADFSKQDGGAAQDLAVLDDLTAAVEQAPPGATWQIARNHILLKVPAANAAREFKLVIGNPKPVGTSPYESARSVVDVDTMTHGGPARYPQLIETQGVLGKGTQPYVVDTLTLPDDNPWKSWMRIGGFDFFEGGKRAAVCTWSGDVWIVSGIDGKLEKLAWKRFATGLYQPLGLKIVNNEIYVLCRDQVTILHDLNGDGEADFYENFNNDISVTPNFHEFVFDLQQAPDGSFFFTKGAPLLGTELLDPIGVNNGCVLHLSKDGKKLENYATGLRAPNGTGMGPHGEVSCSDNQGIWTPVDRVNLVKKGGFYGLPGTSHRNPFPTKYDPPLFWVPYPNPDNSGGGQAWVPDDRWGPFKGDMLYLSYGKCSLFHVLQEEVDGVHQGGIVRFPLKFDTGIMRARFNPADGQLYVAGLRGWQTDAGHDGALQRVRYQGSESNPVRDVSALHITKSGIDISFTVPLDSKSATDAQNYSVQWWNYQWTKKYGSDEYKVSDPKKVGRDKVDVKSIALSPDGKTVHLEIPDIRPVMQMAIQVNVDAADAKPVKLEIDNTINQVPGN